ncbi:HAD hydrolase-like protein [uncultured Bosea sp.]|uniref:HAD-IIA family hydrolase n=1 Tax=uncultured Bosea sp. TaxID=211457 RepID=UPI00263A765B|nr:HAD hydrolase-like protein [uncultured Bosea sp.]
MHATDDIRGWLIDLDGTLVCGGRSMPGAPAFLEACDGRFVIVSNDAEHTPAELADDLQRMGLDIPADRIVLAGAFALDDIAMRRPGARALMLASRSLARHARERGLRPVRARPDIVFLGRDRQFSHAKLMLAVNAVRAGAELVVANPDLVHPGPGGTVVPETGALLAALLACTGPVDYRLVGKPEPILFAAGLALLDLPKRTVAMLGDNPRTDGEGARRFGLRYVEIADGIFPQTQGETACPCETGVMALPA